MKLLLASFAFLAFPANVPPERPLPGPRRLVAIYHWPGTTHDRLAIVYETPPTLTGAGATVGGNFRGGAVLSLYQTDEEIRECERLLRRR